MLFIVMGHDTCDVCKETGLRERRRAGRGRSITTSLLLFLFVLLIEGQDQHELPEECNEVQEEVNAVPEREEPVHSPLLQQAKPREPPNWGATSLTLHPTKKQSGSFSTQ